MQDILNSLSSYGYAILFVYSLGGGMVALIAAGLLAAHDKLDILLCIALAASANFIGDMLLFYFSRANKVAIMPKMRKFRRQFALAQILFKKHGAKIIIAKKYIYLLKTIIPMVVGVSKFSAAKFAVFNAIGAVIWAVLIGSVAFFAGEIISNLSDEFDQKIGVFIGLGAIFIIAVWVYFKTKNRRKK